MTDGKSGNSVAHGWSPVASHFREVELAPGESRDYIFLLGYAENEPQEKFSDAERVRKERGELLCSQASDVTLIDKRKAHEVIARFATAEAVTEAWEELRAYWDRLLGSFRIESGEARLDRMVNIWNQYQCMITFCFSRSASYFESGVGRGMGFRDSNQDLVGFDASGAGPCKAAHPRHRLHAVPRTAVLPSVPAPHRPGQQRHRRRFNDDPMWLIFGTVNYIKETGDFSILTEPCLGTTHPAPKCRLRSICAFRSITWSTTWGLTLCR